MRAVQFTLFCLFLASQAAYASLEYNLTPGVTPVSHDIYKLHMTVFWVCVAIGTVVFSVMIYSMIYHRKSRGAKAAHFHEHFWLEIIWTIIPFFILVSLAIPGTRVLINMQDESKPDLTIKITGFQWKWKYEYIDSGISFFSNISTPFDERMGKAPKNPNYLREVDHPLVIPIHKKIRFLVTSNDVIHSWWVPDLGVKRDAVPGFINETWARVNRPGTYRGQCAELCGINHAFMPIVVIALSQKGFDDWVTQQKGGAPVATNVTVTPTAGTTPTTAPTTTPQSAAVSTTPTSSAPAAKLTLDEQMKHGEQIFLGTCAACHKPDGTGSPPVFPALKGDPVTTGKPITKHIDTVLFGRPGTAMQAFKDQFSDDDLSAVITYERNAWGNNTGDVVQPNDIKKERATGSAPPA